MPKLPERIFAPKTVDFNSLPAVMEWIDELFQLSDTYEIPVKKILILLENNGFSINYGVGKKKTLVDPTESARWLIGQAMNCLSIGQGFIRQGTYREFKNQWYEKFGNTAI